jgi:chloramphenicol O-acetyltransferase type B
MAGNQGHRHDWISTFPFYWMSEVPHFDGARNGYQPSGDTVVGNDVWIGSEAIIMPGIQIGDGAIIGTRALVTQNVEPYAIVGGNPARTIRSRFDAADVSLLLEMKWWEWAGERLKDAMPIMTSGDIRALHAYWRTFE